VQKKLDKGAFNLSVMNEMKISLKVEN